MIFNDFPLKVRYNKLKKSIRLYIKNMLYIVFSLQYVLVINRCIFKCAFLIDEIFN